MSNSSEFQENSLELAFSYLNSGKAESALEEASKVLATRNSRVDLGSAQFIIGCSLAEMGKKDQAIYHLLESAAIFTEVQESVLLAHAQDEIARILLTHNMLSGALFFNSLSISNYEIAGASEMLESSRKLRDCLVSKHNEV